ncbi:thiol-activated cytolysin family protein [Streptomyces noursei]|uniref:thiol-activated cytolysin family protein n=1 Tax=Streptomyces noursei TaxID=1971 RepID=UPI0035E12732
MPQRNTQTLAPAWAVERGDSTWTVEWAVEGATRYELWHVPAYPERDREQVVVARGALPKELTFSTADRTDPGQLVALAFADGGTVPLQASAVGFGKSNDKAAIGQHLREWGEWSKLHPYKPDAKSKVGEPEVTTVKGVKRTKQTYSLTKNPDQVITFNPNVNTCFPGSIVQAGPAIEHGYLTPAQIEDADRADLAVTVDRLTGRSKVASPPSATNVTAAIGEVVGEDVPGSSDIVFQRAEAYSSTEVALELGISGSYGGFAASLDIEAKREEQKNTVLVYLRERAFTAFCDTSTPEALFKDSFTEDKLTRLVNMGVMGPGNPPLLVNSVVYGRILTFTLTSTKSETEINAALKASYSGFAELSAEAKAHYKETLSSSDISIVGISVTPDMVKGLLTDGTLTEYFSTPKKFKEYGIIGYTLQTLDGTPAKMSESTSYDAVVWGEGGDEQVSLTISGPADAIYMDDEWCTLPATRIRTFNWDGSGDPFNITQIRIGPSTSPIFARFSPKELHWFQGGQTSAKGEFAAEPVILQYTATLG